MNYNNVIRRNRLSNEEKIKIIEKKYNKSYGEIASLINRERSTVLFFKLKLLRTKTTENLKTAGRKKILDIPVIERNIKRFIEKNPFTKIKEIIKL